MFVFISTFLISSSILAIHFYKQYQEKEDFKNLSTITSSNNTSENEQESTIINKKNNEIKNKIIEENENKTNDEKVILADYKELYEENNKLYGWLRIDGTNIDYPVMYSPDEPQFYLHKNFNKEDSFSGTPFILVPDTNNIIIYGHNMKNKTMFSALRNYKDMKFWKKNPYIEFDTLYKKNIYEIFTVTNTVVYYDENEIPDDAYLFYQHTCDYVTENARLLVVARKIQRN